MTNTAPSYKNPTEALQLVCRCSDVTEAHLFKQVLAGAGIPAEIADSHLMQTYHFLSVGHGGVRLLVATEDLSAAQTTLEEFKQGQFSLVDAEREPAPATYASQGQPVFSPEQAAIWSALLSPVFGTAIHYWNARLCPDYPRKTQSLIWLILSLICTLLVAINLPLFELGVNLSLRISISLLVFSVIWYLLEAQEQSRWLLKHYGPAYQRRGLLWPAICCLALQLLASLLVSEFSH